jgi:hypothetical protein
MSSERRHAPRIQILGRLHGYLVSLDLPVTVTEISLGGMSLDTTVDFPVGVVHEFRLTFAEDSTVLVRGRIVHCRRGAVLDGVARYVTGIQFIDLTARDTDAIRGLVDRMA